MHRESNWGSNKLQAPDGVACNIRITPCSRTTSEASEDAAVARVFESRQIPHGLCKQFAHFLPFATVLLCNTSILAILIILGKLDTRSIVAMDFVCGLIRPDPANHRFSVLAESTTPNHSLANFVRDIAAVFPLTQTSHLLTIHG